MGLFFLRPILFYKDVPCSSLWVLKQCNVSFCIKYTRWKIPLFMFVFINNIFYLFSNCFYTYTWCIFIFHKIYWAIFSLSKFLFIRLNPLKWFCWAMYILKKSFHWLVSSLRGLLKVIFQKSILNVNKKWTLKVGGREKVILSMT